MALSLETKLKLIFINFIFALTVSSIYFLYSAVNYSLIYDLRRYTNSELIISIIVGFYFLSIELVVSFLSFRQSISNLVLSYYKLLAYIISITSITTIVLLIVTISTLIPSEEFSNDLKVSVKNYGQFGGLNLDKLQSDLKCCGYSKPEDYAKPNVPELILPKSCCPKNDKEIKCVKDLAFRDGCYTKYIDKFNVFKIITYSLFGFMIYSHLETSLLAFYFLKK